MRRMGATRLTATPTLEAVNAQTLFSTFQFQFQFLRGPPTLFFSSNEKRPECGPSKHILGAQHESVPRRNDWPGGTSTVPGILFGIINIMNRYRIYFGFRFYGFGLDTGIEARKVLGCRC